MGRPYRWKDNVGKTRLKLLKLLQDSGLTINDPHCFWIQQGAYRSRYWDLARWGADWSLPGSDLIYTIFSWDTMTDCARHGIIVEKDGNLGWEVHAKERKKSSG